MEDFHVVLAKVEKAETHPDKELEHLSVVTVLGKFLIAGKLNDGSHRYNTGDIVVYVPVNAVIPEDLLMLQGFYWNNEKRKGLLKGSRGNRVGSVTRGSVTSQGILFPVRHRNLEEDVLTIEGDAQGVDVVVKSLEFGAPLENDLGITEYMVQGKVGG